MGCHHHSQLHHTGERLYWQKLGIDPLEYATLFYELWDKNDKNNIEYVQNEIYDKVLPKCKNNIDFLMQVKY